MSNGISRDKYEHYESIILSGQMSDSDVIALLRDNPAFDEWYRTRMNVRRDGAVMTTAPKGPTKGPCKIDFTGSPRVLATDEKGDWPICDIRGWGHLTGKGHGALGLPHDLAAAIQDANAHFIAEAFNVYTNTGLTPRQLAEQRDELLSALTALVNAKAIGGVRELVAGWNGENRPDGPFKERHPDRLGATLPKTNCGAVYALDDAMQAARAAIASATSAKGGAK